MEPWKPPLFILFLILLISKTYAQFTFRQSWCGDTTGTYTPNSTYQTNLNTVLNLLSSDTHITYGFYNFTAGQVPNKVSSLALCRGDVPLGTCRICIKNAANLLPQTCPNQMVAFGYSDYCSIFVSNRAIYGHIQSQGELGLFDNYESFSDPLTFNHTVYNLIQTLQYKSASGNAELKFATGQLNLTLKKGDHEEQNDGSVIYGLVQCTPDLSQSHCFSCIQQSILAELSNCCKKHTVSPAVLIRPSCFVRYDTTPFYGNVLDLAPPPPPPPSSITSSASTPPSATHKRTKSSVTVTVIPATVCLAALITGTALFVLMKRTRKKLSKSWVNLNEDEINTLESLRFSLGVIKHATQGFADSNKLGQGGFGVVYKGVLSDGQEIAVKRLGRNSSGEGDVQFKNEILILAKLQHRNLVRLLGYCLHKQEMLLVYEFMPNRSLDKFLFDPLQRESMLWETRYKVINGISRGLLYLHEESRLRIIHRDLKAANVLLDSNFNPKIADFGMARLFDNDQTRAVASNIAGTFGYMPPEYVFQGQVSMKLDVYSFGVLILEIVSGQRINKFQTNVENPEDLLNFAWRCWRDGTRSNFVDPTLSNSDELRSKEILKCIHIGLLCVQHNPVQRPTMSSIAMMLRSDSLSLPVPNQPALFIDHNNSKSTPSMSSSRSSVGRSVNLFSISVDEFYPR